MIMEDEVIGVNTQIRNEYLGSCSGAELTNGHVGC